jgi:hypothetical protein
LAQRSTRLYTSVALYAVCRWGLIVDDGSWTNNLNDSKSNRNEYGVVPTRIGQVGKTAPHLWVLSVGHASESGALNFVVALKFLENAYNPGYANIIDVTVAVSCPVDIIVHIIHLLGIVFMMSKNVTHVLTFKQGYSIHSEYVIIVAFPLQQWLSERASILRCTHFVKFATVIQTVVDTFCLNTCQVLLVTVQAF